MRKVVSFVSLLALGACNTPFNPNLLPGSLAGTWSGSLSSAGVSVATVQLSLMPSPDARPGTPSRVTEWTVSGHWSMTLPSAADSGTASGKGTGPNQFMHFTLQGASDCSIVMVGLRIGGSSINGTYTASSCAVPDSGTFSITKQ
ncbi:MAG TPA: hypothetical protein VFK16_09135 [Gemmatimonadaceae bacterium]|nr:hypothetical protein [Gemmatimonadaceae bacterium]